MVTQAATFRAGESYITKDGRIVQVLTILSDGSLAYRFRKATAEPAPRWTSANAVPQVLAALIERQAPCDWTLETAQE